jgi:ferritin-like metal-binding protein YciE
MTVKTMNDLFLHQLQDMYSAEKLILQTLPTMSKTAESGELKEALDKHLGETKNHVQRLEKVFKAIGQKPKGVKCQAIEGIIGEAKEQLSDIDDEAVCDAAVIASAQAVEHYEITRYGTLLAWAKELGHTDAIELLKETLDEEKHADQVLTKVAEQKVNKAAA